MGSHVGANLSVKMIGARLGDQLDDAAISLTVLRLKRGGLNVNFLNERQIDAAADRPLAASEYTQSAEGAVGNVHAVSNIEVFQTGSAGNGRVRTTGATAISRTGRNVEQTRHVAGYRKLLIEGIWQAGAYRGGRRVHGCCCSGHLYGFRSGARLQSYGY